MNDRFTTLIRFEHFIKAIKYGDDIYLDNGKKEDDGFYNMIHDNIKFCIEEQQKLVNDLEKNSLDNKKEIKELVYMKAKYKQVLKINKEK